MEKRIDLPKTGPARARLGGGAEGVGPLPVKRVFSRGKGCYPKGRGGCRNV